MRAVLLLVLLFFNAAVNALGPEEFARGYRLDIEPGAPIYRLHLPSEVYDVARFADLRDVRVFNSEGSPVPHALRQQETSTLKQDFETPLPLFPVYRDLPHSEITISDNGSIVAIRRLDGIYVDPAAGVKHYIIDGSHLDTRISKLRVVMSGVDSGFLGRARIDASRDLNQWRTVVGDAALAIMNYGDHQLVKNEIDMPPGQHRYLRFTWLTPRDNVRLDAVSAIQTHVSADRSLNWTTLAGTQPDPDETLYWFNNDAQRPVQQIEVILPEINTLVDAVIRSRPDETVEHWTTRISDSFYRLDWRGVEFTRGPLRVPLSHDREWQMEVKTENGIGHRPPSLRVGWAANDLYFLARGDGPFTLAFGNANISEPVKPVNALSGILNDSDKADMVELAGLGEEIQLLGQAALQKDRTIPWERVVLWMTLGLGVLIIAFMALRLFRQMNPRP